MLANWELIVSKMSGAFILWSGVIGLPGPHYLETIIETETHLWWVVNIAPVMNVSGNDAGITITKGFQFSEKQVTQGEAEAMVKARKEPKPPPPP